MITKGDEYPIHQTPEPIAFAGTDRNFYDRYFFCGYLPDGAGYFAAAFGIYPHLNVADAHFSVLDRDGVQHCVHASRLLNMERMDLSVGPISLEVIEPLKTLRLRVAMTDGVGADLVCEARAFPCEEPRFTRRVGPRTLMDVTRFTQNVRWRGVVEAPGVRFDYAPQSSFGTRDRSWGVRPIGAADAQPTVPQQLPQFYWLWTPTNFPNLSLYAHVNEDGEGHAWNSRASLAMDGADASQFLHLRHPRFRPIWKTGTRHAQYCVLDIEDKAGRAHVVSWTPLAQFQMKGIGYGHPDWAHGGWKGELAVATESFKPADLDPLIPNNLHIQAICKARHDGGGTGSDGIGILEQLVIGPHAPSGFNTILDGASP